jgi:hypothetical protein
MRLRLFAAAATALVLAGCSGGTSGAAPRATATSSAQGASAGAPSAPASPTGSAVIPADALLQPADLAGLQELPGRNFTEFAQLSPPNPCQTGPLPSDALRLAAARKFLGVPPGVPGQDPSSIFTQVARYRDGGAAKVLTDVAEGVRRCPGPTGKDKVRWRVVEQSDDRLLLHMVSEGTYGNAPVVQTTVVGVARTGDVTVVVADIGYEAASGTDARVRALLPAALRRAAAAR